MTRWRTMHRRRKRAELRRARFPRIIRATFDQLRTINGIEELLRHHQRLSVQSLKLPIEALREEARGPFPIRGWKPKPELLRAYGRHRVSERLIYFEEEDEAGVRSYTLDREAAASLLIPKEELL